MITSSIGNVQDVFYQQSLENRLIEFLLLYLDSRNQLGLQVIQHPTQGDKTDPLRLVEYGL